MVIDFNKKPLFLAPMAGFSDIAMRSTVKKFGCDVTVSEMISANALIFESKKPNSKSLFLTKKAPNESPYIVQIAASSAEVATEATLILNDLEGIDGIDLNCGCPVPKVVRQGAGSALLMEPPKLCKIVEAIKKTSNKKMMSVKIRLGFNEKNAHLIAPQIEAAGADFICAHGRTRAGGYSAAVDYEAIAKIKNSVKIPVIANGDISEKNYDLVMQKTNCDGAMIGQNAIGAPWIFAAIKNRLSPSPLDDFSGDKVATELRKSVILAHFDAMIGCYGELGVAIFRKHLHEYSKGFINAAAFRERVNSLNGINAVKSAIDEFFSNAQMR